MIHFCSVKVTLTKNNICSEPSPWGGIYPYQSRRRRVALKYDCFHHESRCGHDLPAGKSPSELSRNATGLTNPASVIGNFCLADSGYFPRVPKWLPLTQAFTALEMKESSRRWA